jgi:hypothetical protein
MRARNAACWELFGRRAMSRSLPKSSSVNVKTGTGRPLFLLFTPSHFVIHLGRHHSFIYSTNFRYTTLGIF